MKSRQRSKRSAQRLLDSVYALACTLACIFSVAAQAANNEPGGSKMAVKTDSVYQLNVPLIDQAGRTFSLDQFRGRPLIVTMFYSSCPFACPRIIQALKKTEAALPSAIRNKVPVLMVSFDVARDDPAALTAMAEERHIDTKVWTLAHSDIATTRKLAAILGIQYRELDSGEFNHTSVLILLDHEGRIVGKTFDIGGADAAFVKLVAKTMASGVTNR